MIDNNFKFIDHSIHINNKLNSTNYIFNNLKINKIPLEIKKLLFNSYIMSHLSYSSLFLFNLNTTNLKKIDAIYSRLTKLTCRLEANNDACSLSSIIEQIIIKTVSHILNDKHPYPLYNLFKIHLSNRTTNRFLLYKKPIKRLTFLYNILKLFNSSNYQR